MANLKKAFEIENGLKVEGVILPDSIVGLIRSSKPTFSGDLLTVLEFYNSLTQVNGNRVARSAFTYTSEQVTTQVNTYYETDGVTVHATETITYSYTGDDIAKVEVT